MKCQHNNLFVIIQPLQYLQALELKKQNDFNILIVLGANNRSQMKQLVKEHDWNRVVWLSYNGTFLDIIYNQKSIRALLNNFAHLNEIFVSSYYNEFMNMIVNFFPKKDRTLLEDGVANLFIDSSTRYTTTRFRFKWFLCKLFGFNINPICQAKIFTVFKPNSGKIPKIASEVIVNDYSLVKSKLTSYKKSKDIYFISSAFIKCGMISIEDYINFLTQLANENPSCKFNIILHRFDKVCDFNPLKLENNINIISSTGPVELYFMQNKVNPSKVITAGSGATESLKLIYGINIDVVIPKIDCFKLEFREEIQLLANHFRNSHTVRFI